jgi:hypothetical protein
MRDFILYYLYIVSYHIFMELLLSTLLQFKNLILRLGRIYQYQENEVSM